MEDGNILIYRARVIHDFIYDFISWQTNRNRVDTILLFRYLANFLVSSLYNNLFTLYTDRTEQV